MINTSKKPCSFPIGSVIRGKWHHKSYIIRKELGYGANGIVYLADSSDGSVAIKFSDNSATIAAEVNVLKSFAKVQGISLGPYLIDVDDCIGSGKIIPFYVMEYISGDSFLTFVQKRSSDWLGVLMLQLLNSLEEMHKLGWVFGDLKPENLIVQLPDFKVRFIDVGGTTQIGRAIKEYTEYFDRGYWELGGRRAEPSYDLFALAMIVINAAYQKRFNKNGEGINQLKELVKNKQELRGLESILLKALKGHYITATDMKKEVISHLHTKQTATRTAVKKNAPVNTSRVQMRKRKSNDKSSFFETFFLVAIITLLYAFYMFGQVV
jgi:serine/threonine protein kinase